MTLLLASTRSWRHEVVIGTEKIMLRICVGWLACLFEQHQWEEGPDFHYIRNDCGIDFHQCGRCGKTRSTP